MRNRSILSLHALIIIVLQMVLLVAATGVAAETDAGAAAAPSGDSSVEVTPEAGTSDSPPLPVEEDAVPAAQPAKVISVSAGRSLPELMGVSDIEVYADTAGQFVDSMAEYQLVDEGPAAQVDEMGLRSSVTAGRSYSRDSLAAQERVEQARAQAGQALGLLLPNVFVRASRGYEVSQPSVVVDEATGKLEPYSRHIRTDITLTASQPLFNLPLFLDWRRRKVKERSREEAYRVSDGDAYVATVKTYLSLVSTRLQADITRDFEAQLAGLLSYIEKRAGAGAASVSDMSRVRARNQATRSSRLELESAHAASGSEFVRLTNIVPQVVKLPVLEDVGSVELPETFELAVEMAMAFNPEVAAMTAELEAEKLDGDAAKSAFLPRFDAEYTDTYSDHAGGTPRDQRDQRIMLVMNMNLFNGGKDYQFHKERAAKRRELRYRLDDQRRRIVHELSAKYAALETTGQRIESGYRELEAISTAAEAMSKRMLSGNQSLLDLLTVFERNYRVRSNLIDLHVLEMNTVAQLIRLIKGAPWPVEGTEFSPLSSPQG